MLAMRVITLDHDAVSAMPPGSDVVEMLAGISDPQERLAWIVEHGRSLPPLPAAERVPANRVPGCVSAVWLVDRSDQHGCRFEGDAEAPVLRGLVALICARASGRPVRDVASETPDILAELKLERQISPTRTAGIRRLQDHLRQRAMLHIGNQERKG